VPLFISGGRIGSLSPVSAAPRRSRTVAPTEVRNGVSRTQLFRSEWVALVWGLLAAVAWTANALTAVVGSGEPSTKGLFVALAFTLTGAAIGITVSTVVGLLRAGRPRRPDPVSSSEVSPFQLPMGVGLLGIVMFPVFTGSLGIADWWLLAGGSLGLWLHPWRASRGTKSSPSGIGFVGRGSCCTQVADRPRDVQPVV